MAPKVDNIIQTTTADDVLDSFNNPSSYNDYDLDNFDLSNYDLDDFDLSNYDLDDYDLDNYDLDNYDLDNYDLDNYDLDNYDLDNYDLDNYDLDNYLDDDDLGSFDLDDYRNDNNFNDSPDDNDSSNSVSGFNDSDDLLPPGSSNYHQNDEMSPFSSGAHIVDVFYFAASGIQAIGLVAFFVLLLLTLLAGLRKNDGTKPAKSTALSLVFFILWSIFQIVQNVAITGVMNMNRETWNAISALTQIWYSLAQIMLFLIFYRLLHDRFNRLASTSGFSKSIKLIHWGVLGLLSILYAVRIILNIVAMVRNVQGSLDFMSRVTEADLRLLDFNRKFSPALDIISWVLSLEILACSIIALVKTRSSLGGSIASPVALVIAAFTFFVGWLVVIIVSIRHTLMAVASPSYLIIPTTIFNVACPVVIYIAFILLIVKSDRWETPKAHGVQPQEPVQYQQPQAQYAPTPGTSPVPYPQPTPPTQQDPGTPPAQPGYAQQQAHYAQPHAQYAQPHAQYAQPHAQYAQVPIPAPYPSQSPHPQ